MLDVLSVDNMRKSDAATIAAGTPGRELMMRAARGVYECVKEQNGGRWNAPVAIVCGSGNNAGDGYALALLLHEAGIDCTVFCVYDRFSEDGKYYYDKCVEAGVKIGGMGIGDGSEFSFSPVSQSPFDSNQKMRIQNRPRFPFPFNTIVDCLLGTGFKGEVRPELKGVIEAINTSGAYVVSVDINSGLNGDTGMAETCVRSDLTVSVGGFKPGHFLNMAKDVMKDKVNVDIGIRPVDEPYKLIESEDVAAVLGTRSNYSNKGTYGYTALIGGSTRYSGAIRLAYLANAAMRSGAGVVKVALPSSLVHDVAPHILESTLFPLSYTRVMSTKGEAGLNREDAVVDYVPNEIDELISNVRTVAFGMGIGTGEGAAKILTHLLTKFSGTLIIDADGLTLLSRTDRDVIRNSSAKIVLTPHIKEFSRLTGKEIPQILEDPIGAACEYAKDVNAVVLLKGPSTIVTNGEMVYITNRGCAGMATAGS
ncbi:MAG: NAD(P)H-hydrate epimerase, partial [Lachnospiraceae bacterium]|nr:NAD(P)H-hydrate epimerase [Lachnospiraceae bacterium]